jgi:uncharacterized protein YbbC (DUF1343 family)
MPATAITGSQFTFTYNAVAYSAQVTGGTVTRETAVTRIKTLTDMAYKNSDDNCTLEVSFLYDEETGLVGALNTAQGSGTANAISLVGGDAKWTGNMSVSSVSTEFTADGIATCSATLEGALTFADAP